MPGLITRRQATLWLTGAPTALAACGSPGREVSLPADWGEVLAQARGQIVHLLAWAGDPKINAYIEWAGQELQRRHGVTLRHVKTSDTSSLLTPLLADKTAGRATGGRTDLLWINGENFIAAKQAGLLFGPITDRLPNWRLVDTENNPAFLTDFTVPTEGYESPWGWAQLTFFHDAASTPAPPRSIPALLDYARAHPGRLAYPAPPDFVGVTFLKQALYELSPGAAPFSTPAGQDFAAISAPLWAYLDALHPHLWRQGKAFPQNYPALRQLLEDREIDLAFAFNPAEASTAVGSGLLPATTRAYVLEGGTIRNAHFFAVPFNASSIAGALAAADFMLSPEAQARKADPGVWGDPSVLSLAKLSPEQRALFEALPQGAAQPPPEQLARHLSEPHPSWHLALDNAWRARYAA